MNQIFFTQGIGLWLASGIVYVSAFTLFQEETNFGYDFHVSWNLLDWGSSDHDKQFIFEFRVGAGLITFAPLIACMLMRLKLAPPNKRPPILISIQGLALYQSQ